MVAKNMFGGSVILMFSRRWNGQGMCCVRHEINANRTRPPVQSGNAG